MGIGLWLHDVKAPKYVVANDGTGDFNGTDETPIQNALNALTSGRTWKEKVVVRGDFEISNPILVPSYTILDCSGARFKLPSGADYPILKNKNYGGFDEEIEVVGGVFDGNNNTFDAARALIDILGGDTVATFCKNIIVKGAKVVNIDGTGDNGTGIWLKRVTRSKVLYCWAENCKGGISVEGTHNYGSEISHCVAVNNKESGIIPGLSHAMIVSNNVAIGNKNNGISCDSPHRVIIRNNFCASNDNHGIALFTSIGDSPEHATVEGNLVWGNSGRGISITPSPYCIVSGNFIYSNDKEGLYVGGNSRGSQIVNNKVMFNGYDGIRLYDAHNCVIEGNICLNNGQAGSGYSGIYLEEYANGCVIVGNKCYDDQSTKTQDYGISVGGSCTKDELKNNICLGNKSANYNITSSGVVICDGIVYTDLPSSGIEPGDKILYYDGTNYILAVWDGSTWRQVTLS